MQIRKQSEEVLFADSTIVTVTTDFVATLKEEARANRRRRIRFCAHTYADDPLHEMIIIHSNSEYIRPHRHLGKSVSYHVIEGDANLVVFTERGDVSQVVSLGTSSERQLFCRLSASQYYMPVVQTEQFVFHETVNGPFDQDHTEWAPWSPVEDDQGAVQEFLERLNTNLELT